MTKTYVIVGASTGLGRATARTLSRDPNHRVIDDRSPLRLSNGLAKEWARDYLGRTDAWFRR
jgi:NAD(P)-dependent dehydrogenase (short-subunit alcohol dehydrogenase family)